MRILDGNQRAKGRDTKIGFGRGFEFLFSKHLDTLRPAAKLASYGGRRLPLATEQQ